MLLSLWNRKATRYYSHISGGRMMLLWALLSQVTAIPVTGLGLLLAWAVYYHFSTTEIPPGICQPLKLRLLHIVILSGFGLGYVLWKMGICGEFTVLRMLVDGIPPMKDSRLSIKDVYFEGVPVRIYRPRRPSQEKQKGLLFFHGGSGTVGSLDTYERVCRHFARRSNVVVVSVGYRLAPEHRYPAQFEDSLKAAEFLLKNAESHGVDPARVVLSGDGFGATIAAYVAQELVKRVDLPRPRAQVLIGPFLQALDFNLLSYQQNRFVPLITQRDLIHVLLWYITNNRTAVDIGVQEQHIPEDKQALYKDWLSSDNIPKDLLMRGHYREFQPSTEPSDNVYFIINTLTETKCSPLIAEDAIVRQLPETFLLTCEFDVLRDDGLLYKKRLEDNGVPVSWCHLTDGFHGMLHLFNLWFFAFPFAEKGVDNVVDYIKSL